jgi:hypothetical protein
VIPSNALNSEFANFETPVYALIALWPGCIKRCQVVVKVNIMSSDLIGDI